MARRLQAGAGPNLPSHSGNTPLHVACAAGARLPLLRLLTHARAGVSERNARGETPLHLLAMSAAFEAHQAAAHLLSCGARLGARDERGATPLHTAVTCGRLALACQLVGAGSSLVVRNGAGHTVLDLVAWQGGAPVASRLLEAVAAPPLWVPDGACDDCMPGWLKKRPIGPPGGSKAQAAACCAPQSAA